MYLCDLEHKSILCHCLTLSTDHAASMHGSGRPQQTPQAAQWEKSSWDYGRRGRQAVRGCSLNLVPLGLRSPAAGPGVAPHPGGGPPAPQWHPGSLAGDCVSSPSRWPTLPSAPPGTEAVPPEPPVHCCSRWSNLRAASNSVSEHFANVTDGHQHWRWLTCEEGICRPPNWEGPGQTFFTNYFVL